MASAVSAFKEDIMRRVSMIALVLGSTLFATGALAHGGKRGGHADRFEQLDTNKDGKVTPQEAQAAKDKLFGEFDVNGDGVVTADEAKQAISAKRQRRMEERFARQDANGDGKLSASEADMPAKRFERLDTNKDKLLTKDEMRGGLQQGGGKRGKGAGGYVGQLDANKDGKVTREEARTAAKRYFDRMDKNADGVITKDEMSRGRRGGKGQGKQGTQAKRGAAKSRSAK